KPDNILIPNDGDWPMLVDFGLVSSFGGRVSQALLETTGILAGTVQYISPEQVQGHQIDARSDLYAIGCILHEIVTGRVPFEEEENVAQHLRRHLVEEPQRPMELNPAVPPQLDALILKLLAKDPHQRPGHANAVIAVLNAIGIDVPTTAYPGRPYLYKPTFVGRRPLMRRLGAHLRHTMGGKGRLVLLQGESGSGKTRIAQELVRRARNHKFPVLTGHCVPVDARKELASPPLHAFEALFTNIADRCLQEGQYEFDRLLGDRASLLAPYAASLRALPQLDKEEPPPPPDSRSLRPEAGQNRLFTAVGRTMEAWSDHQPMVLVLDDLQWSDELSLGCLRALAERYLGDHPWLILGLCRSDHAPEALNQLTALDHVHHERLPRMSHDEVTELVRGALGLEQPPEALLRFVTDQANGNPFHVTEYLRVAVEQGLLVRDNAGDWILAGDASDLTSYVGHLAEPRSIQELLVDRLDRLPKRLRRVCEVAAVLGHQLHPDILTDAWVGVGHGASLETRRVVQDAIDDLVERDILTASGRRTWRFTHDKLREVAYMRLSRRRRARLHQQIAGVLEVYRKKGTDISPGLHGHHLEKAGQPDEARQAYLQEARFSAARFAFSDAERYFKQAFAIATDHEPFELLQTLSPELIGAYLDFVEMVLLIQGRSEEGRYTVLMALEGAQSHNLMTERGRALFLLGQILFNAGEIELAMQHQKDAYAMFQTLKDRHRMGESLGEIALLYQRQGEYAKAMTLYDEAIGILQNADARLLESHVQANKASALNEQGKVDQARTILDRLLAYYRGVGNRYNEAQTLNSIALIDQRQGNYAEAQTLSTEALSVFRQMGDRRSEAQALLNLGNLDLLQSRYTEARTHYAEALTLAEALGDRRRQGLIWAHQAVLEQELGQYGASHTAALKGLVIFRELGDRHNQGQVLGNMATTHQQQGRLAEALKLYEQALSLQRGIGDRRSEGYTLTNLGSLYRDRGQHHHARQHFDLAIGIARELGDRRLEASTHLERAHLYRYVRDRIRANNNVNHALKLFNNLGDVQGQILCLCELAHQAIATHRKAERLVKDARTRLGTLHAPPESAVGRAVHRLERTFKAYQHGAEHLRLGNLPDDLPLAVLQSSGTAE
ncbi:MAG: tetratricopeptide repeat protein, partial [Myxococcota bacterium]